MSLSPSELFFFSAEIQKEAGMPAPQNQSQPEKKKNIVSRHMGKGTLALGALGAAAAIRNPAAAGKYLGQLKDTVMRPGVALKRGFRSGSSNVMKGPGASEAASKRVRLYRDVLQSAQQGRLQSVRSLDDIGSGANTMRARGFGSAGRQFSRKGQELKLSGDLKKRVDAAQSALAKGEKVDEKVLRGLYQEVQQAGKGLKMRKGVTYYAPGERASMMALGGGLGATAGLEAEDPETGRKRGVAERIARGTVGAAVGTMATPLFMGRGAGLAKQNVFTGKTYAPGSMGMLKGLTTQKAILPIAGSTVALGAGGIATDVAGGGGQLVDKAFGQKS